MQPYYSDDWVTIYHGDCREVIPQIGPTDVMVTDPPYGLGKILHRPGPGAWGRLWAEGAPTWDAERLDWVVDLVAAADEAVVWGGNYFTLPPARGWLVWDKVVRSFSSSHCELAWTTIDQPVRAFSYSHGQLANDGKVHPTQKPLPLMEWAISFTVGLRLIDPFMGSGTTLVAAKNLGRRAIGIELEERYCEIAAQRCSQGVLELTGTSNA